MRPHPDDRLVIDIANKNLEVVSATTWKAIAEHDEPPHLFAFGNLPARIQHDRQTDRPYVRDLGVYDLRYEAARAAVWVESTKSELKTAAPPLAIIHDLFAFPRSAAAAPARHHRDPGLRRRRQPLRRAGYQPTSALFYAPTGGLVIPPIPANPTDEEIATARTW